MNYNPPYLDNEEKDLVEAYDTVDDGKLSTPDPQEQKLFKAAAKTYVKSESKMNIRIDSFELEQIKQRAKQEGLKYSALVKMVLHKYITGQFVESR